MAEAVLLTRTENFRDIARDLPGRDTWSFPIRIVEGIELPNSAPVVVRGMRRENVDEEVIALPDVKMGRLADFVTRIVAKEESLYYNCVTFAAYMHSGAPLEQARPNMRVGVDRIFEVAPDDLSTGSAHLIYLADQKTAVHSVVGINDPAEHLAVWGDNSPLAIGNNVDMLRTYNAAHIMQVDGYFTLS